MVRQGGGDQHQHRERGSGTAASAASYTAPWVRGQCCIVPMEAFFEPNRESGKHIRWKFSRRDHERQ
jgi:putative SOS response-associated peptidase YedK